jgi:lipid A oxidase
VARALLVLVALALASPARAAGEVFLDVYTGQSRTRDADLRVREPPLGNDFRLSGVAFDDESFDDPPYYGLRAGYFLPAAPWAGFALDFTHFKVFAETGRAARLSGVRGGAPVDATVRIDSVVQAFSISHGVNYLTLDVLARARLMRDPARRPNGALQLYAGLGAGPVIGHPENRVEGRANRERYEYAGLGALALVGARVWLTRRVGLFVEYRFTAADLEVNVAGGEARVDERTHHVMGGVGLGFGGR